MQPFFYDRMSYALCFSKLVFTVCRNFCSEAKKRATSQQAFVSGRLVSETATKAQNLWDDWATQHPAPSQHWCDSHAVCGGWVSWIFIDATDVCANCEVNMFRRFRALRLSVRPQLPRCCDRGGASEKVRISNVLAVGDSAHVTCQWQLRHRAVTHERSPLCAVACAGERWPWRA